ncbi:hypothetical protein [Listeria monocytogenes]|uniref:hypothetical protein n=1 Tax=Listeria monocytogenes TaxID=1639 RepID=UPI00165135B5
MVLDAKKKTKTSTIKNLIEIIISFEDSYQVWFKQHSKNLKQTTIHIKEQLVKHILPQQ